MHFFLFFFYFLLKLTGRVGVEEVHGGADDVAEHVVVQRLGAAAAHPVEEEGAREAQHEHAHDDPRVDVHEVLRARQRLLLEGRRRRRRLGVRRRLVGPQLFLVGPGATRVRSMKN